MFTHRSLLVNLMTPDVIYSQLVNKFCAHSASRQIHQECVLYFRPSNTSTITRLIFSLIFLMFHV